MRDAAGAPVRFAYVIASVAGIAFFVLSVALLGIWPARILADQTRAMSPEHPLALTASEQRGRLVYSREGCAYCHTQQVRFVQRDMARFGAPTLAWETQFDYPQLWGTRRIGPDLARAGGVRAPDWQFAHLFSPRAVVPQSVMPSYTALFEGAADRPSQDARDLVAYLDTLGRARELAAPEGDARAREGCNCAGDEMQMMGFEGPLNAHPARARRTYATELLPANGDRQQGLALYADHCAGCHGAAGAGDGVAASGLLPRPRSLAAHEYTLARISEALSNGVAGTAMPAWRDRTVDELAALAAAVRGFNTGAGQAVPLPENLNELGARVYAANCVQCHGEHGAGDGAAAAKLPMAPLNFTRQRLTLADTVDVIRNGIDGTPMAPWTTRLGNAEVLAVANYVRGFFVSDTAQGAATR